MAASDPLQSARTMIIERIAELEARMPRLAPMAIAKKMDAIRCLAAEQGMAALEGLADYAAHHALMPGHRQATRACLEHMGEALGSDDAARPRDDPRRACGSAALGTFCASVHCLGQCAPSASCSTISSIPARG